MVRPLPALVGDDSGQAIVEAAVVLPLALLFLLGLLQLALIQEARLLTEYAGYRAGRTGSLWNGDEERMALAAAQVLGPLACGREAPCPSAAAPLRRAEAGAAALLGRTDLPGLEIERIDPSPLPPGVRELDFDDLALDAAGRRSLLLEVHLRFWFELQIPFADAAIWRAWHTVGAARLDPAARRAVERAAARNRHFIPIATTHTVRMQSNRFAEEH